MMRLATKAGRAITRALRRPKQPQVTPVVACHQESPQREALTKPRSCPSKGSEQVVVQDVTVDAHATHELGHVSTLPGEHHFRVGVVGVDDRGAHFVASTHRFPGARIDVLTRAEGRPQRRGR